MTVRTAACLAARRIPAARREYRYLPASPGSPCRPLPFSALAVFCVSVFSVSKAFAVAYNPNMPTNILLSGVGGQGIVTASTVLAEAALLSGCQVKKSEIHGMSQRGGSVESHVRYSPEEPVYSPTIPAGEADILMAFEALEALRALPNTCPDALILVDDRRIPPMSVVGGQFAYPEDPIADLRASGRRIQVVDSFRIASELGEVRAANLVMLGAASNHLPGMDPTVWHKAIAAVVRPKALEVNLKAFEAGKAV